MIDRTEIALWLRAAAEDPRCHGLNFDIRPLLKDGADEIERLREEIERLREKLAYHVRIHNEMYNRLDLWGLVAKFEAEQDSDD